MSITKRFGNILANDRISFTAEGGGIHAIVGENGAGKSTLTKILCGFHPPDSGCIYLDDSEVTLRSASDARALGIGMVHQQLALVPSLTGLENVALGDITLPFAFSRRDLEMRVSARAKELGFDLDLSCPVSALTVAERQKLEVFRLLWKDARILILDEPTSHLSPFEAEDILTTIKGLADSGRIVILITHHIAEVMRFAKHITVLRNGRCVATTDAGAIDSSELARLMVDSHGWPKTRPKPSGNGQILMSLNQVSSDSLHTRRSIKDITLDIRAGEIIGIAGVNGSGQTELGELISGLMRPKQGAVSHPAAKPQRRTSDLVGYIPSDQSHAFVPALSLLSNCSLKSINATWSETLGFVKSTALRARARRVIEDFGVSPAHLELPASRLSGGNRQRLIVGRELSEHTNVIVADNPCASLDAASAMMVRQQLRQAADSGRAVVFISPDLEELVTICDRILVMFNGRVCGEQSAGRFDRQSLALLMVGKS